jgi:cyclase
VGDPLNAVRIFNEKGVDELVILDIDASRLGKLPNEKVIAQLAAECRMPLCYGGGVNSVAQIEQLISLGVEKVAISSAAIKRPELVSEAAKCVGSQSVVVVIDVKKTGIFKQSEIVTHNATVRTGLKPEIFARKMQDLGAGEIILNSVDQDGTMLGYNFDLVEEVYNNINIPLTALGGAGSISDLRKLVLKHPIIGAAAGSFFVFKGKYRAVLINYPKRKELELIAHDAAALK